MKKLTTLSLLLTSLAFIAPAYAGTGHAHDKDGGHSNHGHGHSHASMASGSAMVKATGMLQGLINKGVIDKSWEGTKPAKAEKKIFAKGPEWVVSFFNDKVKDKAKQTLYIFYSLDGHYIAANYSGQ